MCIPPNDNNTETYFKSLSELNYSLGLKELSIGTVSYTHLTLPTKA